MPDKKQTDIKTAEKKQFQHHLDQPAVKDHYKGSGKLKGKVAIVTGGDSGIGRSVAVHYAREGADVSIVYLKSDDDAIETQQMVESEGRKCLLFKGDISDEGFCKEVVAMTHKELKKLDILVNNAGTHEDDEDVRNIETSQLIRTFEVNIFSFFYFTQAALEIMEEGSTIINTTSVTAYRGSEHLIDYASTKGAIVSFTRSLAKNLAEKKIRVNGVAPGPVWTPLVVYSFDKEHLEKFGKDTPLGRAGYPNEIAPAYVYLASDDSSYMTGQILHINGGDVVNG
ncbi:MAG: NAD(P)-dependent oxidoreductase [Flavipsychrobacter sp.]|jgi:NAD(P)-dependent dehydrogenase (short-subunit alcohol dehydrogenase family)|nr:NAD(P)-dependent oxidoreductase [Flavipsychrobacter sp.]